jgi:3-hydroxybutyryl-CoA dehydrogenase
MASRATDPALEWPALAAVVGAGTMGTGFAQCMALAGIPCVVADASAELAASAVDRAVSHAARFERDGLIARGSAESVAARVSAAASVSEAVGAAQFIVEAVAEDPAVKRRVLAQIEADGPRDAVIATNTSAIPIRELGAAMSAPERFLGTHWFNPPMWVPCVEVIPGPLTGDGVIAQVLTLLRRLGKEPVRVGDAAGFVANRIQFAMFREAALVVADGIASAEEVDVIVSGSFGFRLPFFGPFAIADMAGLDVYAGAYRALQAQFGSRLSAPESIGLHVGSGRLGTKTNGGYLDHTEDEVADLAARRDRSFAGLSRLLAQIAPSQPGPAPAGESESRSPTRGE